MNRHPRPGLALRAVTGLVGAALIGLSPAAEAAKVPSYAITKAKVITVSGAVIDNATVVTPDVVCSNGVIHVIDHVLLPAPM